MEGRYIIGCIKIKDGKLLKSAIAIKNAVLNVCKIINLNVVDENYHAFNNPKGITYCFILSQSHFVVHTWPEKSKVFFDIFTCGKELNKDACIKALSNEFNGKVEEIKMVGCR